MRRGAGTLGKFATDDKVEVLSSEEGFSDAWAAASVVSTSKTGVLVEYTKFVDEEMKNTVAGKDASKLEKKLSAAVANLEAAHAKLLEVQKQKAAVEKAKADDEERAAQSAAAAGEVATKLATVLESKAELQTELAKASTFSGFFKRFFS